MTPQSDLARALNDLIPREPTNICKVCTLLKTLTDEESALLAEAVMYVGTRKLSLALREHGHTIGRDAISNHRNYCGGESE